MEQQLMMINEAEYKELKINNKRYKDLLKTIHSIGDNLYGKTEWIESINFLIANEILFKMTDEIIYWRKPWYKKL